MSLQPPADQPETAHGLGQPSRRASIRQSFKKLTSSVWKRRRSSRGGSASSDPKHVESASTPAPAEASSAAAPAATSDPPAVSAAKPSDPAQASNELAEPSATQLPPTASPIEVDQAEEGEAERPRKSATVLYIRNVDTRSRYIDLFSKYELTLELGDFYKARDRTGKDAERRVERPIRMRVRYSCHSCQAQFSTTRTCRRCGHQRCGQCPRVPAKKRKIRPEGAATEGDPSRPRMTNTSRVFVLREWGDPQKVQARLVHYCHKCDTDFVPSTAQFCPMCGHHRCPRCPKEVKKYGDAQASAAAPQDGPERVYRRPKRRVKWTCHQCHSLFNSGLKECKTCNHRKCDDCIRSPPKSVRTREEPGGTARLEQQFSQMGVVEPPTAGS